MITLSARSIRHVFTAPNGGGVVVVLGDVDLEVAIGQIVCLIGRSGAGKTTLLNILAGIVSPTAGRVSVNKAPESTLLSSVGYLSQKNILFPWLTVLDNVALPLILRGIPASQARDIAAVRLALVMLSGFEHHFPHQISGGMSRRACLARVLTEPTSNGMRSVRANPSRENIGVDGHTRH